MKQVSSGHIIKDKAAHWSGLIESWSKSGKSQVVFCKETGINKHSFQYWKRVLSRREALFIPVEVKRGAEPKAMFYKVETVTGVKVSIPSGAQPEDLRVIFQALRIGQ